MAGLSSTSAVSSSTVPGSNVAPVSFPGIASGVDYNSIIQKLTAINEAPIAQYQTKITSATAANSELIKINGMLASVQSSLTAISDPSLYSSYDGLSSQPGIATANGVNNVPANPGSYTIDATTLATSTTLLGTASANFAFTMSSTITNDTIQPLNNGKSALLVPLSESFASTTPSNGAGGSQGKLTIDGVQINYNVGSDNLTNIISRINAAVQAVDPSFNMSYSAATDSVTMSSTNQQISVGSASDSGNLASVLKLDTAHIDNVSATHSVTSAGGIGGVNVGTGLNSPQAANLRTAVTDGFFTINGVRINVSTAKDNVNDVLNRINSSTAGVVASFDRQTGQISLNNKQTGAQSIVVGGTAYGDTSNFLDAVGLSGADRPTSTVGQQASVTIAQPGGGTRTYYSNSNSVQNAIAGLTINVAQSTTTPFTITVTQDSARAITAISNFASAYNAAINEINVATAPPVVQSKTSVQSGNATTTGQSSTLASGGLLYGNTQIQNVKDHLVNIVTGLFQNGSYSSLSTIGLQIDSSVAVLQANTNTSASSTSNGPITTQTFAGTSGQLQALDAVKFAAALAANPVQVSNLFAASGGIVSQLGVYLTGVTGQPTLLSSGLAGNIPSTSLLQTAENENTNNISSLQQLVKQLTDRANSQADQLRSEFVNTEAAVAGYQSLQSSLGQLTASL